MQTDKTWDMLTGVKEKKAVIKAKDIVIEYEITIATAQFENVKPKIKMTLETGQSISEALELCRDTLREHYKNIKGEK